MNKFRLNINGKEVTGVAGQTILESRRRLRPQDVGLLASIGVQLVSVVKRPRVRVLATGEPVLSVDAAADDVIRLLDGGLANRLRSAIH